MNLVNLEKNYGSYDFNGITLYGVDYMYADDDSRGLYKRSVYKQSVIDKDENEYMIMWDVLEEFENSEDCSDHCDWTKFRVYDIDGHKL